jgi:predicted DsbA family dithiol-disulfide isomerase
MKRKITIDVVSDIVCPWCYIGKRRLESAMSELVDHFDFEVTYHPFELNPDLPTAGLDHKSYLVKKFGSEERYNQLTSHVTEVAAMEGLNFNYAAQKVSPNTRKAHAIIQYSKEMMGVTGIVEELFQAYFIDGVDLSKDENLIRISERAGLNGAEIGRLLSDQHVLAQVEQQEREMYKLGITGVPFYIINNKYGISGAQAPETFIAAFKEVGQKTSAAAESCDVDLKNC